MGECVVVGCDNEGEVIVGKPTYWGAWEYWVCIPHKKQVEAGATINDNADGCTIYLSTGSR